MESKGKFISSLNTIKKEMVENILGISVAVGGFNCSITLNDKDVIHMYSGGNVLVYDGFKEYIMYIGDFSVEELAMILDVLIPTVREFLFNNYNDVSKCIINNDENYINFNKISENFNILNYIN